MKKFASFLLILSLLLALAIPGFAFSAALSDQLLSVDGLTVNCEKYNVDGFNYFKLRDLGDALGFTVDYDADSNTAIVLSKGSTAVYQNAFVKLLEDVNEKRRADMAS